MDEYALKRPTASTAECREIAEPIYYDDGTAIHACESCLMYPDDRLVWTRCDRDVPANQGFTADRGTIGITCIKCLTAAVDL
jgi:hypothetical protein